MDILVVHRVVTEALLQFGALAKRVKIAAKLEHFLNNIKNRDKIGASSKNS